MTFVLKLVVLAGCVFGLGSPIPVISDASLVVTLYELTTSRTKMTDITCADNETAADEMVVSLGSVSPSCFNCFQVYPNCGGGIGLSYCLEFLPVQPLDYETNRQYNLELTCRNERTGIRETLDIQIRLYPNTPPSFSTANSVSTTLSNTENVGAGGSVYATQCTDPDSDRLTYTLSTDPPSSLFFIDSRGVIRATSDLRAACFSSITFAVTCQDPYNDAVGPVFIQTTLNGANEQPRITGLNFNLDVPEDVALGYSLGSYTVTDDDISTTCRLSTNVLDSLQYFELDQISKMIKVRTALNYENTGTQNTNLTVTCTDGFCTSSAAYVFVRITDVNEPLVLYPQDFTLSTYEGDISIDPDWDPDDEDFNEVIRYSIEGGNSNGRFKIDSDTGVISSTVTYDVDESAMPTTDFLIVQARDSAGHTSTSTVSLTILDINDNRPIFTVGSQTITITDCTSTIGNVIGTAVTATDRDSALDGNNVVTYTVTGSSGPFTVDRNTGNIIVGNGIQAGQTYSLQVTASDAGSGPRQSLTSDQSAFITIIVTTCPTTTPAPATTTTAATTAAPGTTTTTTGVVTTSSNSKESVDFNLGWIIFAGLLATVFLAALAFMLWRYCYLAGGIGRCYAFCNNACDCGDCCTPRPPPRAVKPYRGQPPRNGNRGFWQERYPDDDYIDQPDRDRTPSPAPYEGGKPLALEPVTSWRPRQADYLY